MITSVSVGTSMGSKIAVLETPPGGPSTAALEVMATRTHGFQTIPEGVFVRAGSTVNVITGCPSTPASYEVAVHGYLIPRVAVIAGETREFFVTGSSLPNRDYVVPTGKRLVITACGTTSLSFQGTEFRAIENGGPIWGYVNLLTDGPSVERTGFVLEPGQSLQYSAVGTAAIAYGYLVDA